MRIATIASFGASAVLGLGALVVARTWLPTQIPASMPRAAAPEPRAGVPVVLASGPIAYGAKLKPGDLILARLPAEAVPAGAFSSIDQVMKQDAGGAPVALVALAPREPLLPAKISGPGAKPTLATMIGEGMRAYTISVTETAGGGGHVMPGDRVDVVLTRSLGGGSDGPNGGRMVSDVVIQNVKVLGMDQNVDPNSTRPSVARTATLEVSMRDAERLALAAQAGTLSMALRRVGAADVAQVGQVAAGDLGPAGPARRSSASAPRKGRAAAPSAPSASASVTIVHGEKRDPVAVPADRIRAGI